MSRLVALRLPPSRLVAALREVWEEGDAALVLDPDLAPGRIVAAMKPAALRDADGVRSVGGGVPVEDGTALVVATSGTTGAPKAVALSHAALQAAARTANARLEAREGDRWLCCLPVQYIAGLMTLVRSAALGTDPVVLDRFAVDDVGGAEFVSFVPPMLARCLDAAVDLTGFRAILLGGGPAPQGLLRAAREAGARVVVTYGSTETCGGVVYDGVSLDGVEVRLDDQDVIEIRGPMLMQSYRGDPELTADTMREGWFHTRDLGAFDADGRLVVRGRIDDMIVTGGANVAPVEVESVLAEHPDIIDVAVWGEPDLERGERVVAAVVARGNALSAEDVRSWVGERLPRAAIPKDVRMVASIRRNASGKIMRGDYA